VLRVVFRMVLICVLAYAGVKVWYNRLENYLLSSVPEVKVTQTGPAEKKVEILRKSHDYTIIIDRNIFGAALDDSNASAVPVEELQQTKLKLALMGTVSGDQKDSRAIISDETSRKQDIYKVGDTIQDAVIKAIERRRVVLNVNGRDEVLNIKDREGGGPSGTRISSSPPSSAGRKTLKERMSLRRPLVRPEPRSRPRPVVQSSGRKELEKIRPARPGAVELGDDTEITDKDLFEDPELLEEEDF